MVINIYVNYIIIYINVTIFHFLKQITSLVVFRCWYTCVHNAVKDCIQELIATRRLLIAVATKWANRMGEATQPLQGLWS